MLSIICVCRGDDVIIPWLNYHIKFFEAKLTIPWEIILSSSIDLKDRVISHPNLRLLFSPTSPYSRLRAAMSEARYTYIMRIADDDYLNDCSINLNALLADPQTIGVVPNLYYSHKSNWIERLSDPFLITPNSVKAELDLELPTERITSYITPPLPGDNGPFYGIYKREVLVQSDLDFGWFFEQGHVATDWAMVIDLLSRGKILRAEQFTLIRHMTPFSKTLNEDPQISLPQLTDNEKIILKALPMLPALTFIRDYILENNQCGWRHLVHWNAIRHSHLRNSSHSENVVDLNFLDIVEIFNFSSWEHSGSGRFSLCNVNDFLKK